MFDNLSQFFERLSAGQRLALGLVLVGTVTLLTIIAYWANQNEYALLFRSLDSSDASQVVESLQGDNISYELREDGTAIYVPRDRMHELRLQFAGEGIIARGHTGYELFDESTLGMTDFMQKLNRQRALEGELSRTIANIRQVEQARVHLVMPERSPFREAQSNATASVVVQLGSGELSRSQVRGITSLVAGAVEGMSPDEVTVLDTSGDLISDPDAGNDEVLLTSNQLRQQQSVESHLTEKGQSMLDRVLGRGNAIVRVSAELDFSRSVSERELIDPESSTIISEEQLEEEGIDGDGARSMLRNYELSRTTEREERGVGGIENLTVSVVLNHRREPMQAVDGGAEGEEQQLEYVAYEQDELEEIEELVMNAVGFSPERGDRITIQQTRFDPGLEEGFAFEAADQPWHSNNLQLYLRYGLILVALLLAAWLLRSVAARLSELGGPLLIDEPARAKEVPESPEPKQIASPSPEELEKIAMAEDKYQNKLSPEAQARLNAKSEMYQNIKQQAESEPEGAAELIRSWISEDVHGEKGVPA